MEYNSKKHYRTRNGQFRTKDGTLEILAARLNQSDEVAGILHEGSNRHLAVWSPDEHCDGLACTLCELMEDDELDLVEDVITEKLQRFYILIFPNGEGVLYDTEEKAIRRKDHYGSVRGEAPRIIEIPDGNYRVIAE